MSERPRRLLGAPLVAIGLDEFYRGKTIRIVFSGARASSFDGRKYVWLGAPTRENAVCALTKASGITSVQ